MLLFSILEGVETQQRAAKEAADGAAFAEVSGSDDEFAWRPHGDDPSLERKASICCYHLLYLSEHDQGHQVHAM